MLDLLSCPELLTPDQMGAADRLTIAAGTPGFVLMQRAGAAVADETARLARSAGRIAVFCGPGANGGDGFVAARLLRERGYRVEVALLGRLADLRGDASQAAAGWDGKIAPAAGFEPGEADLVIDALFGAGLARDLTGEARACVEGIIRFGQSGRPVLAVDLPSGVDGATGAERGAAVRATASVTFFRLKPGHLLLPGRARCGRIVLADIGIGAATLGSIGPMAFANSPAVWRAAFPDLRIDSNKYARGSALVLSGGASQTGAARLAARAALRVGAGLVTLASPLEAVAINAAHSTAVMVAPFDGPAGFAELLADARRNAIVIGPAAGVGAATKALVATALARREGGASPRSFVLDADALTSFAGEAGALAALTRGGRVDTAITPHDGEFARLFRANPEIAELPSKLARARAAAAFLGAIVVSKGADTVVAEPGGRATIGVDLPPTLATAGSGDVLAGLIGGLLAQGMPIFEAASCAVWLHGAAAQAFGPGLIAEDLPETLPQVLRGLAERRADFKKSRD
ncbi:NAD(P)H-hydrate dehydratase [Methylocapsa sp. S129]|uniref:NAD(P)H-hydrate dehydratase n=1 Tax=Methylocapsa sp. S129 TaxID=1641869 RepID=UPI00131D4679|nr:NAD(P)H-hydrate dehydratase [Methylocapsa sp. S129]